MTEKELNERLLKRLPKKYHNRFVKLSQEDSLIDNCKYILYYSDDYSDGECNGGSVPVKSIDNAIYFLKFCLYPNFLN